MSRIPPDIATTVCGVQPATLRSWARHGHVTRHPDGSYDYDELIGYRDTRTLAALAARAGIRHPERISV